jgi:hypothetical protein
MKKLGIVIFGCLTKPKYKEQIEDCYKTWVKDAIEHDCIVRFYVGDIPTDIHEDLKHLCVDLEQGDDYISATFKQWRGFEHMVDTCEPCEFYFTCGTDTFMNVNNALKVLETFHTTDTICLGGGYGEEPVDDKMYTYFSGGAGVFISLATLNIILEKLPDFIPWWLGNGNRIVDCILEDGKKVKKEILGASDLQLGILCHQNNIQFISLGHLRCIGDGTHNREGADKNTIITCHLMKHNDFYDYWNFIHAV